jgi:hypothetical protein
MASGRLASENVTTVNSNVQIYQVPTGFNASFTINACNRGTSNAKIRISLSDSGTPALGEYVDFDVIVYPKESYQRTGVVLSSGQYVFFYTDQAGISVNVYGFEETV